MGKIRMVIFDDEQNHIESVKEKADSVLASHHIEYEAQAFDNYEEAAECCLNNNIDVIIMDVQSLGINGFRAMQKLDKNRSKTILITARKEFILDIYKDKVYAIVKRDDDDGIVDKILKLAQERVEENETPCLLTLDINKKIQIDLKHVMYLRKEHNYIYTVSNEGEEKKIRGSLGQVYKQLKNYGFIFVQRSYLVNCRFIDEIGHQNLTLIDGTNMVLARRQTVVWEALEQYAKFVRDEMLK